jgi:mono/diheme cytochrome c family protein
MASAEGLNRDVGRAQPATPDLESDVERIHRPLLRESRDPTEGHERAPWWLWAVVAAALFWGGWYLGRYGGVFGPTPHLTYLQRDSFVVAQATAETTQADADPVQAGQAIYTERCQACHQQNGRGLPGVFPPLIGSEWETGDPDTPVRILLHGLHQPIEVAGETFNGVMPAWGSTLSDEEIAAVVTFIRQWDVNDAGPVEPKRVGQLRAETAGRTQPWTADELRALENRSSPTDTSPPPAATASP